MADIDTLKKTRSSIKAQLTRFITAYQKIRNEVNPNIPELENRLLKIEPLLDNFNDIQLQIEISADATLGENSEQEREEFENKFFETITSAKQFITSKSIILRDNDNNSVISDSPIVQLNSNNLNIKLPPITLPSFSGNYDQWLFFKDSFTALIHENTDIPPINKFHYLRLSLKGEAANLLTALSVSADNYIIAWEMLKDRYENKPMLVKGHIKALFEIETIPRESFSNLRKLLDNVTTNLNALKVLGEPIDTWDTILIHLISNKLDPISKREWESKCCIQKDITFKVYLNFLNERCKVLENLNINDSSKTTKTMAQNYQKATKSLVTTKTQICTYCKKQHLIYNCKDFTSLDINKRYDEAKRLKLCINCLRNNHTTDQCRSIPCHKCKKHHNTLLHFSNHSSHNHWVEENVPTTSNDATHQNFKTNHPNNTNSNIITAHAHQVSTNSILLSTALVYILDNSGQAHQCRVLLDSGSESNFITKRLCDNLNLHTLATDLSIQGISQSNVKSIEQTQVTVESRHNPFKIKINCFVLNKITGMIPQCKIDTSLLKIPTNIMLADTSFNIPGEIDMLIGADHFWNLICIGQIKLGKQLPILQRTQFGWIISGSINTILHKQAFSCCNMSTIENLNFDLSKFWQIEERFTEKQLSPDEQYCENLFEKTTQLINGRFQVTLPLKHEPSLLGDSKQLAIKRFLSLEKRLEKNPILRSEYTKFMQEYENLNHMTLLPPDLDHTQFSSFYLPHHAVLKESSTTTKCRVVFDGSAKTTSEYSLNDILHVGPTVQQDLFSIVLRARKYNVILTGDIAKMYRQVVIEPSQRKLQLILWRSNPSKPLETYELNTLTYGTAPAAYLSTRCIKKCANETLNKNPKISYIIANDFYVDDLLTGGDSIEEVTYIKTEVTKILESYGFQLRKFLSNKAEIIYSSSDSGTLQIGESNKSKTLGLLWDSTEDTLLYSVTLPEKINCTKRSILSIISQIFDPLGLISPVVIVAKVIVQKLWASKTGWDETVTPEIYTTWKGFCHQLSDLNKLKIPRQVTLEFAIDFELHCFSDASESAYGTCIYLRSKNNTLGYQTKLLCAKTRVAPLKTVTIARLELCAALLQAELAEKVKKSMNLNFSKYFYWSDSTITLTWIRASPHLFKTFVSNRVSQIQSITDPNDWHYVNTKQNPADILSRGMAPASLINNKLWWYGPNFLAMDRCDWPIEDKFDNTKNNDVSSLPERKGKVISLAVTSFNLDLFERYSSLTKLQRVTAYCLRYIQNLRLKRNKLDRQIGPLSTDELNNALRILIRISQHREFSADIEHISKHKQLSSKSTILKLTPFLDEHNILRVGGRLRYSDFDINKKHPILLPKGHPLTRLIAKKEHIRLLHAGPTLLLSSLRDKYWPISGRNLVRNVVRSCIKCFRYDANEYKYVMADLPKCRVSITRPFLNVGIDFCGPFLLKDRLTKHYNTIKSYVCLFVCLSTKAIHLEITTSLSTNAFMDCLRRFFARRGISTTIYSDNGSNFIGAKAEIRKLLNNNCTLQDHLSSLKINWKMIPPKAPHFGGIWEAGVKSAKYHLKRVLSNVPLTFEQFNTIICQIEACLNSRPISPLPSTPNDLQPLTPSHFLIGAKLTSLPEDATEIPMNRLNIYRRQQQIQQNFWKRWYKEYISELQQRYKWSKTCSTQMKPGLLVLIKEDNLPPLVWKIGVIETVHPGEDGVVRAATIRTSTGRFQRPTRKLCPLPTEANQS